MSATLTDSELLSRLVSFDSTSTHSNLPIADFICDYLERPGVEIVRNFNEDRTKTNLVIRLASAESSRPDEGLLLCGHLDVVPADEPDWRSDPFRLSETESTFVGRGACDMKGFVALAVNLFRQASGQSVRRPLALLFTYDEEPGTLGAQHFAKTWHRPFELPRRCVVGEPTELRAVRMHKGHLRMRVTLHGKTAHTGYPHLGVNAIEPAASVISTLSSLRQRWQKQRVATSVYYPQTPYMSLTISLIRGGTAMNVVPDRCQIDFGVRLLPGMEAGPVVEEVRSALEALRDSVRLEFEVTGLSPPLLLDERADFYRLVCSLVDQSETHAVSYATDGGPLQPLGLECVVFGPGSIEVAHKANEFLPKDQFLSAGKILRQLFHDRRTN